MVRLLTQIYQVRSSFDMSMVSTTQGVITCLFNSLCSFRLIRQCPLLGRLFSTLTSFLFFFSHQHVHHQYFYLILQLEKIRKLLPSSLEDLGALSFLGDKRTHSNFLILKVSAFLWPSWIACLSYCQGYTKGGND